MTFCYTHKSLLCSRWEKNIRDPQPNTAQRMRDFETAPNEMYTSCSSLRAQGTSWKRKQKDYKSQKGIRSPGRQSLLNQHEQRS